MSDLTPYRVVCVVGTRPEAIKMAPVVLALREDPRFFVCSRGVIAKRYPYNYAQSLGKVEAGGSVAGNVSLQVSEENPRQFYRRWRDYMNGADWDTLLGRKDKEPASFAA